MAKWPFVQKVRDKWRGWIMVGGKRRYLPLRNSAREASEEAIDVRKRMRTGPYSAMTLGDLATKFLEDVKCTRKFGTWDFYSQQLDGVFRSLSRDTALDLVCAADMRLLIHKHQAAKFSAQTIQHRRAVLRRMFRWAKKCGISNIDPTVQLDWPTVDEHAFDVLDLPTLRTMLERLQSVPADYDLVLVASYTGMRRGELARIRLGDIDLDAGVIWVQGKRRREPVHIDDAIAPSLVAMIGRATPPFLLAESRADRGKKERKRILTHEEEAEEARARTVANTFRRWAKRFKDRRFHPHTLRHTIGTELTREGETMASVGSVLRHKDPQTTKKYIHLVAADRRRATGKLRLIPRREGEAEQG